MEDLSSIAFGRLLGMLTATDPEVDMEIASVVATMAKDYNPRTAQATSVKLRAVVRTTQPPLDNESFWQDSSFADLRAANPPSPR